MFNFDFDFLKLKYLGRFTQKLILFLYSWKDGLYIGIFFLLVSALLGYEKTRQISAQAILQNFRRTPTGPKRPLN